MIEANTDTYVYDETWKDKLISYNGQTITYDAVGNPTNYMGNRLTWTMGSGNLVASYTYDPWGKVLAITGSNVELGELNPFRYRSYYYDGDIEMYYLQSRYYDPEVGRFINCDDVNYIGITGSEVSYNPFAYCENNPVNKIDKTGTIGTPLQWAFTILGTIVGFPFGKWLANRLGYYNGWKYYAIRSAAVVGGAALGWFAGATLLKLIKTYLSYNPRIMIKIVSKFGAKALYKVRCLLGLNITFVNSAIAEEVFARNVAHIFSKAHIQVRIMNLGTSKWFIFYKAYKIVVSNLHQAVNGSNQIYTYINGYKVTIRFYMENNVIRSFDIMMGWAQRIIGKLLK